MLKLSVGLSFHCNCDSVYTAIVVYCVLVINVQCDCELK